MFVRPFQGPTDPCLCPGASRKAARPRLLTFVLTGRENLARKQELDHLLRRCCVTSLSVLDNFIEIGVICVIGGCHQHRSSCSLEVFQLKELEHAYSR